MCLFITSDDDETTAQKALSWLAVQPPRNLMTADFEVMFNLNDTFVSDRKADYCNMCNVKGKPQAMSLCCCAFNCVTCCITFFELESVRCPSCNRNWAPLQFERVMVNPVAPSLDDVLADQVQKVTLQKSWLSVVVEAFTSSSHQHS